MRTNLPVTGHEILLDEGKTIVSTTDLQGNITYANPYFSASTETLLGERPAVTYTSTVDVTPQALSHRYNKAGG